MADRHRVFRALDDTVIGVAIEQKIGGLAQIKGGKACVDAFDGGQVRAVGFLEQVAGHGQAVDEMPPAIGLDQDEIHPRRAACRKEDVSVKRKAMKAETPRELR